MRQKKSVLAASILLLLLLSSALSLAGEERPGAWAQPLEAEGVPNLYKVSGSLYRSAQPSAEGMKRLKALGVKTVVNLRAHHSDEEKLGSSGLLGESVPLNAWDVDEEDAVRFLKIVADPGKAPVLVHCMQGADRTGAMCAVYRIAVQGWSKEEALREMRQGGYGFHEAWLNMPGWVMKLDAAKLRKEAGIPEP